MIQSVEVLRVLAFIAIVAIVYVAAAGILVRRYTRRPRPPLGIFARAILAAAAAGALCMLYGRFVEPRWLEVTETRVPTARLPAGHRGMRIVHLSDMHCISEPLLETRLPDVVASLKPDVIVFTGDAANSAEGVAVFRDCFTALAKIAPTFGVKGNWDAAFFADVERFAGTGAVELDGTSAEVDVDGVKLHVVGAGWIAALVGIGPALAPLPPDGPAIVLYHPPYPDLIPTKYVPRVDLVCAGHVHGGQVAMPFYGALLTLSKHGKKYERGLYRTDEGLQMYVSRGVGMEGGPAPRVRFCSRPEVALIELVPAAK